MPRSSLTREYPRPGPIVTEDGAKDQYLIEKIIDARRRGRGRQYLLRWVGYVPDHDEWLPGFELEDCEALDAWEAESETEVWQHRNVSEGGGA
ncbi:hypothetical protein C0989_004887, partial [Termitomyces sp. Mn162]